MEMDDIEFNLLWNDIWEVFLRLVCLISFLVRSVWGREIEKLYVVLLMFEDESEVRELKKMYENEVRSKEEIKNIENVF